MALTHNDFDKICRCCLTHVGPLLTLYDASVDDMMYDVFKLKMDRNDGYPQKICRRCIVKLSTAHTFKRSVFNSHQILTDILMADTNANIQAKAVKLQDYEILIETNFNQDFEKNLQNNMDLNHELERKLIKVEDIKLDCMGDLDNSVALENIKMEEITTVKHEKPITENIKDGNAAVNNKIERNEESSDSQSAEEITPDVLLTCKQCHISFLGRSDLKEHQKSHKELCQICNKLINKSNRARHSKIHSPIRPYSCGYCGVRFADVSNLKTHKKAHLGIRPSGKKHLCSYCGMSYKWKTSLNKHLRFHTGPKMTCEYCDKSFVEMRTYRTHLNSHKNIKPYKCTECGEEFSQKSSLNMHVSRKHNLDRKLYQCEDCSKTFFNKGSLTRHIQEKHGVVEFKCDQCQKKFSSKYLLKIHLIKHKRELQKKLPKPRIISIQEVPIEHNNNSTFENVAPQQSPSTSAHTRQKKPKQSEDTVETLNLLPIIESLQLTNSTKELSSLEYSAPVEPHCREDIVVIKDEHKSDSYSVILLQYACVHCRMVFEDHDNFKAHKCES